MAFFTIQGVTVNTQRAPRPLSLNAQIETQRLHSGFLARSAAFRDLFNHECTAGPFTNATRRQWELFLGGVGETWMFEDASEVGSRSSEPNGGGSYTADGSSGPFNGHVTVDSGSFIELPSDVDPDEGWTLRFWRKQGAEAWKHWVVFGTGTDLTLSAVSASVDGAASVQGSTLGVDDFLDVASDGDVQFQGTTDAGINNAIDYAEIEIRPFNVVEGMATGMSGETLECYPLPRRRVGGELLGLKPNGNARTIQADIRSPSLDHLKISGDHNVFVPLQIMQAR